MTTTKSTVSPTKITTTTIASTMTTNIFASVTTVIANAMTTATVYDRVSSVTSIITPMDTTVTSTHYNRSNISLSAAVSTIAALGEAWSHQQRHGYCHKCHHSPHSLEKEVNSKNQNKEKHL